MEAEDPFLERLLRGSDGKVATAVRARAADVRDEATDVEAALVARAVGTSAALARLIDVIDAAHARAAGAVGHTAQPNGAQAADRLQGAQREAAAARRAADEQKALNRVLQERVRRHSRHRVTWTPMSVNFVAQCCVCWWLPLQVSECGFSASDFHLSRELPCWLCYALCMHSKHRICKSCGRVEVKEMTACASQLLWRPRSSMRRAEGLQEGVQHCGARADVEPCAAAGGHAGGPVHEGRPRHPRPSK